MATPQNNAYDIVYTLGADPPPVLNADVKPLSAANPQTPAVSDIITSAIKGNEANAQRYVNAVTAVAGAEAAQIAAKAITRQRSGKSGFADLATVVQQGVQIAYDTRARSELARSQQEAKIAEGLAAQKTADANIAFEREQQALRTEAPDLLRSEGGAVAYRRKIEDLVNRYQGTADTATTVRVTGELFAPLQSYSSDLVNATQGTIQAEQDAKRNIATTQFMTTYSGRFEQIAQATTPDQQLALTNELIASIGTDTASMSPFDRAQVTGSLLTELNKRYDLGSARFATANATLSDINGYSNDITAALNAYEQDGNLSNFRFNESRVAAQYPNLPTSARYQSPDQDLQHALDMAQLQNSARDARKDALLSEGEALQLGNDTVTDLAYTLFSNPASQPLYDAVLGTNPEYKQALAVAALLTDQQKVNADANEKIQQYQLTAQNLSTANVEQTLSWANSQDATQRANYTATIQNLLAIPGVSAEVKTLAQQYIQADSAGQGVPPAVLQPLNQAVIASREQSINIVNSQIALESQRITAATAMLAPYGLDTPDGVKQQLANSQQTLGSLNTRITTARQAAAANQGRMQIPGANGAVQPDFRMPRLTTATVGNVTAPLPFAEGTTAPLTGGDGLYHQYRTYYNNGAGGYHQGMDIAVPIGTPVTAYIGGTVTYAGDATTYGNLVEITSPDGYVHRFAHLDSYSVRVGDTVQPGQVLAQSGNTGRGSGPHLHWEVRVPSEKEGGGETMNPLEYTAGLQQREGRRPRNGQEVTQQGTQLGNGQTMLNSHNAGYSAANPLRQRYASTRAADYQRSADGSANYGYAALAEDRPFRLALHQTAARMGLPAQWLADVMGYETGGAFGSNVKNQRGSGAVGIIQFMPDTLAAYGYTSDQFAGMSNVQQLTVAARYLEDVRKEAGLERWRSPYDVLMAVWGGGSNLHRFISDPESVRSISDGDITWQQYTDRLGSNAGRKYQPVYGGEVQHVSFVQGCPTCNSLAANGNAIYPHTIAASDVA